MNTTAFNSRRGKVSLLLILISGMAAPAFVFSQTDDALTVLARQIAEKRARVETLSDQVEDSKAQYNEDLRSLETQIADVEIQINREQLRLNQIERDILEAQNEVRASRTSFENTGPIAGRLLVQLRAYVENGFPFQKEERLAAVGDMEQLLADGTVEPEIILTRAWNMVESEFRLAAESGIYRQVVMVNGEEQLSEVAKVGSVFLYFKTFNEDYGYAVPVGGGWEYRLAADRDERQQIAVLFDSLRRNIEQGFFIVPNPNAIGGGS